MWRGFRAAASVTCTWTLPWGVITALPPFLGRPLFTWCYVFSLSERQRWAVLTLGRRESGMGECALASSLLRALGKRQSGSPTLRDSSHCSWQPCWWYQEGENKTEREPTAPRHWNCPWVWAALATCIGAARGAKMGNSNLQGMNRKAEGTVGRNQPDIHSAKGFSDPVSRERSYEKW